MKIRCWQGALHIAPETKPETDTMPGMYLREIQN